MELVTKKKLHPGRRARAPASSSSEVAAAPAASRSATCVLSTFANGEIYCRYGENIRGADVFVFQTHCDPINDRIMEQLIMIDAAKRASAKRITAVCPFYGYARQDRKAEGREPITARLVADMLTVAGADRVVTVDLHTGQIQGFFDFPVDHLTAVPVLAEYLARERRAATVTVVVARRRRRQARPALRRPARDASTDRVHRQAPARRARTTSRSRPRSSATIDGRTCVHRRRHDRHRGHGGERGRTCSSTGARARCSIAATHGLLSGPAVDRLKNGPIREVVVTNTVPIPDDKRFDNLRVLSIAPLLAEAIDAVFEDALGQRALRRRQRLNSAPFDTFRG